MDFAISSQISEILPLNEEQKKRIDALIPVKTFRKGTVLLKEGQIARDSYFTIRGCVRAYKLMEGEERTTAFYVEEDPITSATSYNDQVPANHYLECVEDCVLAILNYEKEKELYREFPQMESLCRVHIEKEYGKQQEILADYLTKNPEERYLLLMKTRPSLLQRVPQYLLASFIGVQPESLSRIRKRLASK